MSNTVLITIGSVVSLLLPVVAAWTVLRSTLSERPGRTLLVGFAIPVGLGASALVFLASLVLLGRPLSIPVDAAVWLGVSGLGWWLGTRRANDAVEEPCEPASWSGRLVMGLAIAAALVAFTVQQFRAPQGGSDAVAIWNLHARVLTFAPDRWTEFLGAHENGFHVDYPLLIPAAVARIWSATGGSGPAPSLVAGAFLLGTICLLFGALRALRGERTATFCTTVLVCSVYFVRTSAFQFADAPFACYLVGAVAATALARLHERRPDVRWLGVAGLLAGLAAFTKNEGLLLLAVFGVVWACRAVAAVVSDRDRARPVLTSTVAVAAGLLPGVAYALWYKWSIAPPSELVGGGESVWGRVFDLGRFAVIARGYGREAFALVELGGLALIAHALLTGRARDWRANPAAWMGAAVVVLQLGGYFAVYLTTPYDLEWHVGASLRRLYVHVWPTCLLLYGCVFPSDRSAAAVSSVDDRAADVISRAA